MNFSELQILLEKQNTEVIENQKESLVGRKALAERTKGMLRQTHLVWPTHPFTYRGEEDTGLG